METQDLFLLLALKPRHLNGPGGSGGKNGVITSCQMAAQPTGVYTLYHQNFISVYT